MPSRKPTICFPKSLSRSPTRNFTTPSSDATAAPATWSDANDAAPPMTPRTMLSIGNRSTAAADSGLASDERDQPAGRERDGASAATAADGVMP